RKLVPAYPEHQRSKPANPSLLWRRVAAVFVGATLMGLLYYFFMTAPSTVYYATDFGEIQTITLPDGSKATLNGNSTLQISENWEESREVWLDGEAFFEVKKIPEKSSQPGALRGKKFLVHTHHLAVEVLGTTFN